MQIINDSRPYDLRCLLASNFMSFFKMIFIKEYDGGFPERISVYKFEHTIKKFGPRKSYKFALYRDSGGREAIAKMRSARIKAYHYYSLKNEINLYRLLNNAFRRTKNNLPSEYKQFYIPELIATKETKDYLLVLIEYINGKPAASLDVKGKYELYFKMSEFVRYLGENLTPSERLQVSTRKAFHFVFLYPFLLLRAMMVHPENSITLLSGLPVFFRGALELFSERKLVLIHRDLHFLNILLDKNRIVLIDLQQCVISEQLHEYVTTLRDYWLKRPAFYRILFRELLQRNADDGEFNLLLRALMVNSATHGLTGVGFNKAINRDWLNFLRFALRPNYSKFI